MKWFLLLMMIMAVPAAADPTPAKALSNKQLAQQAAKLMADRELYEDKVYGCWYGKLIGLILGQPVEGWTKQDIAKGAREAGAYPVRYYFPGNFKTPISGFLVPDLDGSPMNDDSDLMLTSLLALRDNGINLTPRNIADAWVKYVGGAATAEGVALMNFRKGVWPPESAKVDNPYAEMIGSQMRADIWGMIAPGMPDVAARYAEIDACTTHVSNGIYAAQYTAALTSVAMVEKNPEIIVRTALKTIPADCAYARAIKDVLDWHAQEEDWQAAWELMDKKWGFFEDGSRVRKFADEKYNTGKGIYQWPDIKWVWADVNGAVVTLALLYGDGNFDESICIASMCGYDNDCNTGTVGAIVGAIVGENAISWRWKDPIHDIYKTGLKLPDKRLKISAISRETAECGRLVYKKALGK